MSLENPFPVKLTAEQLEILKALKQSTGYPVGTILRTVIGLFVKEYGGKPEQVQAMFRKLNSPSPERNPLARRAADQILAIRASRVRAKRRS